MPRELVTIQVGQCGMQLGTQFWEMALREHAQSSSVQGTSHIFDESLSSFFRNTRCEYNGNYIDIPYNQLVPTPIYSLRARAVCIDMEEGVLNSLQRSPLGQLFDQNQFVSSVSGAGNNWAHGHCVYGPQYADSIIESIRNTAEKCDSLQSFFIMHSLGGGTGSGLGSYILHLLEDYFPNIYRINISVCPSQDDDVVTSPYNTLLSLEQQRRHSDCVLPVDNDALLNMVAQAKIPTSTRDKPHTQMNNIVATMLTSLTAPVRFPGSLNVDLNELTMNLVPYPSLHFVVPSLSPHSPSPSQLPRSLNQCFSDALSPNNCLLSLNVRSHTYLALGLFARGPNITMYDVHKCVNRLKTSVQLASWNPDGLKLGLCHQPGVFANHAFDLYNTVPNTAPNTISRHEPNTSHLPSRSQFNVNPATNKPLSIAGASVLTLSNTTAISDVFIALHKRFRRLYMRKAHVHHYTQYCEIEDFEAANEGIKSLIHDYKGYREISVNSPNSSNVRDIHQQIPSQHNHSQQNSSQQIPNEQNYSQNDSRVKTRRMKPV